MEFTKDNFIKFLLSNDVRKLTARFQISIGYAKYLATRFCNIKRNGADLLLSDPSPIIGNACHSLLNSCLVNLIDVILACEDAYSKLVEVVTVADVDGKDHVGHSLLHTWELRLGNKAKLLFRL